MDLYASDFELCNPLAYTFLFFFYVQIVPTKRGRWYGMGSASECIATSSSFTPSPMITTLQTQLQSTQDELHATKEVVKQQRTDFEQQIAAMKDENEARFKQFEDRFLNR